MKLRALIVDDEELARRGIRRLLEPRDDVELIGECANGREAVRSIRERAPDVVFLDVQMPGLDGFDVISSIGVAEMPAIVFLTAHDEYAIRAFEVHALDYLLKPVEPARLERSVDRVRELLAKPAEAGRPVHLERLPVKEAGRISFVDVGTVSHFRSARNYVRVHVAGRVRLIRSTLSGLADRLDPHRFVRIHRSTLVNVDHVDRLEPRLHGEYAIFLDDGTRLTSSRRYRRSLDPLLG